MSDIINGDFPKATTQQEAYLQDIINSQLGKTVDTDEYPEPTTKKEAYMQAIIKNQQSGSGGGQDGAIFTPSVSSAGVISWTNNGGLENPDPVNIKGPAGATGASIATINLIIDSVGLVTGGTATMSDGTSVPITVTTEGNVITQAEINEGIDAIIESENSYIGE